jgi:hypothetical protein
MADVVNGTQPNAKERRKKKRKKKKRTSVVFQDPAVEHRERTRSDSRSVAPMSAASTITAGQRATQSVEPIASASGTLNRGVLVEEEDKAPVLSVRTLSFV